MKKDPQNQNELLTEKEVQKEYKINARTLQRERNLGIVMTAIFPGVVITKGGHWEEVLKTNPKHAENYLKERCPVGRFGEIDEIGRVVAFYCSDLASFCHGAIIPVDAGQSKHYMAHNYLS